MKRNLLLIGLLVGMCGFAFAQDLPAPISTPSGTDPWFLALGDGVGDSVTFEETATSVFLLSSTGTETHAINSLFSVPGSGVISVSVTLGTNWTLNVTTGQGSTAQPVGAIDLNSVDDNGAPGTLTIAFSQTGITTPEPGWDLAFGGTVTNGYVESLACLGTAAFDGCSTPNREYWRFGSDCGFIFGACWKRRSD